MRNVLVTGGAGYLGSHACVELAAHGYRVYVVDNFSNSSAEIVERLRRLSGNTLAFERMDVRDPALGERMRTWQIDAVMHFAALKSVSESVFNPISYYENNVGGLICLVRAMQKADVSTIVFSSSATVYGVPEGCPIPETAPVRPETPYGRTKFMAEQILLDLLHADGSMRVAILRYFNPVGAHPSGLIGESPLGVPNNLMPYIGQVADGTRPHLNIFGNDYPTRDGTGIRDYIHVMDLARAHLRALDKLQDERSFILNLGTGRGYSVLEVIAAYERASGRRIPYQIQPRRAGDVAECYADPRLAETILGWKAERDLSVMCEDAWRWQSARTFRD